MSTPVKVRLCSSAMSSEKGRTVTLPSEMTVVELRALLTGGAAQTGAGVPLAFSLADGSSPSGTVTLGDLYSAHNGATGEALVMVVFAEGVLGGLFDCCFRATIERMMEEQMQNYQQAAFARPAM